MAVSVEHQYYPRAELFTAVPIEDELTLLHQARKLRWKLKFMGMVEECKNQMPLDVESVYKKVETLDIHRGWSPAVYFANARLFDALKEGYLVPIIDSLHCFNMLTEEEMYDSNKRIDSILTEAWEPLYIEHMRKYEPKDINGRSTIVIPLLGDAILEHVEPINSAIELIQAVDPVIYKEYEELVSRIKLFDGRVLRGESGNSSFGAIFFRIPPKDDDAVSYWIEHIVHEISHLKLEILSGYDEFFMNDPNERFKAPIRRDPRPMLGILHATFVLSRMVRVFNTLVLSDKTNIHYQNRLKLVTNQFESGLTTLRENGKLTVLGKQLFDSFTECAYGK